MTSLWSAPEAPPAEPPPRDPPPPSDPPPRWQPPRRRRPYRGLALLLAVTALGGGVAGGAIVALMDGGSSAVTREVTTIASGSASTGLNAKALYAAANPGVVDITARGVTSSEGASPFGQAPQSQTTATGTGFVVDKNGTVVTAAHVVDSASSVSLTLSDGTTHAARVLGSDDATDVAVLKFDASGLDLQPLRLGNSSRLEVGDGLAAIGDPFGYRRSISTGIVSGLDRTLQAPNGFTVAHAIQTDATLNPGNSGGPVLNSAGEVVGVADQIATNGSSQSNSGVGFATPIDLVKSELATLERGATVRHAYLGVSTSDAAGGRGAAVQQANPGGPAARAGLSQGDVVTAIGSAKIADSNDLVAAVATHQPGDQVTLTVRRGGAERTVRVTLGRQPNQATAGG